MTKAERANYLASIQVRSALIGAEMAEAALARNLSWMISSTLKLRLFITDNVNPFFRCNSEDVLLEIDAHVARLRIMMKNRARAAS